MVHLTDGNLQAWIDGELAGEPEVEARVRHHVGACEECADRLTVLRQRSERFSRAMLALDEGTAAPADPGPLPLAATRGRARRPWRRTGWGLARAAGLLLVVAGAASAIVPGSPVRSWIGVLLSDDRAPSIAVDDISPRGEGVEAVGPTVVGVAADDGRVEVRLRDFGRDSKVHVRLTDAGRATVRVEDTGTGPRFVTAPGQLEVIGTTGDVWVDLPRSAHESAVTVDGEPLVRVTDGEIRILRPAVDSLREEVVFRIGG